MELSALIEERAAAALLGVVRQTLAQWRRRGVGPPYVRISVRCVRYRPEDLAVWIAARVSTEAVF